MLLAVHGFWVWAAFYIGPAALIDAASWIYDASTAMWAVL